MGFNALVTISSPTPGQLNSDVAGAFAARAVENGSRPRRVAVSTSGD
jgi:hypothetical protein